MLASDQGAVTFTYPKNNIDMAYPHITLTFDDEKQNKALKAALDETP